MSVTVKDNGMAEKLKKALAMRLGAAMAALDPLPIWTREAVLAGQDVTGAPLKATKDGKPPLHGSGDLLAANRFAIGPVVVSEKGVSRTLTYHAPEYYQYIVKGGRAFILPGTLNPNVKAKAIRAIAEGMKQ